MTLKFTVAIDIRAPHTVVYGALSQINLFEYWKSDLSRVDVLSGPRSEVTEYSMWREIRGYNKNELSDVYEVAAIQPGQRIKLKVNGWKGSTGHGTITYDYYVVEHGVGSDLIMVCIIEESGFYGLLAKVFLPRQKRQLNRELNRLKMFIEARQQILTK